MLGAYPAGRVEGSSIAGCTWIDLVDPTDADKATFEQTFGLRIPTKDEVAEIETSSRLQIEKDALYMTAPLILTPDADAGPWISAPAGFVLSKQVLLTVRSAKSVAVDKVIAELGPKSEFHPTFAFVRIAEALVDRLADLLEASSHDLDEASHSIFRQQDAKRLSRETAALRQLMIRTGRISERMARIHYTLVCLDRMAKFTIERCNDWIAHDMVVRLQAVSADIASLVQFSEGLVSRVQLLQDAATGIISIDQNDVMKVLTVASVVGIPPVLVVGIYGMNFKNMPELDWAWGYPYALLMVVVTAALPLIWFKWKDWI
jgi:magnesium transporter